MTGAEPFVFTDPEGYRNLLRLSAHELFHAWNVKRIRPTVLGPFAYEREVHTSMLWFAEGFTRYYGWLLLARAGLESDELDDFKGLNKRSPWFAGMLMMMMFSIFCAKAEKEISKAVVRRSCFIYSMVLYAKIGFGSVCNRSNTIMSLLPFFSQEAGQYKRC